MRGVLSLQSLYLKTLLSLSATSVLIQFELKDLDGVLKEGVLSQIVLQKRSSELNTVVDLMLKKWK
jgi:hypothetical protein